ncbi:MAG: hypothetical protein JRI95_00020 [Deltaproteobacteria bacterium]|nr:hypothetical protein [Deltaproteobacteria bacterium]MBW2085249.1 hypothetical protein [Deltaproteobacteria bacterium]
MESEQLDQFELLVQKVDALLVRCQEAARAREELETLLSKKEEEIEALKKKALSYEQEKARVRAKVDEILSRIAQFETG